MEVAKYHNLTDEELVPLILKDQDLYLVLMKRYETRLKSYIRRLTDAVEEDIEDILQEVYIKTYRNLNGFNIKMKFSSWIYRVAHNETISHFRRRKIRPKVVSVEDNAKFLAETVSAPTNLEQEMEHKLHSTHISEILSRLDHKYRQILILRFLEERDYKEIADIIKKPIGTVGTLINRAKIAFKKESAKTKIGF